MNDLAHLPLRPIRDQVTPEEWKARVDLAACYRLAALVRFHIERRRPLPDFAAE